MAPPHHRPRHHQKRPVACNQYLSRAYLTVSDCVSTYGPYIWYVTTFYVTFLSVTHHIRTYILCENISSIQSLTLMSLATREWSTRLQLRAFQSQAKPRHCTAVFHPLDEPIHLPPHPTFSVHAEPIS